VPNISPSMLRNTMAKTVSLCSSTKEVSVCIIETEVLAMLTNG
jgi:hypothetical protein